jgi:ubiquinone/menaquinone biosynthesis C-methylase UbiE
VSNPRSANAAASVREQKLARVIDREVAPIWHDRFARMLMRELPNRSGTFVLDVHSGPGHTTAELLQRLDESSRVVALGRDPWLMQIAKTHVKPEWKRRVYFKAGDIDDVTEMADATYDLSVANLVLGEHVVDWKAALAELRRVTKPGGHVLATVPLFGTWDEVEDLFEELLRDEGMTGEVATLQKLRRRRPKPEQIVKGLAELGFDDADWVVEHERFDLLFRSGREFLFAPVIEHGPLRLWKAILGRAEQPQALFWRFKEVIDTYYAGKVLAVGVVAGLIRVRVPGPGVEGSFAASYWSRYPELARLWKTSVENPTAKPAKQAKPADEFVDLDLELDFGDDDDDDEPSASSSASASASASLSAATDSGLLAMADVPEPSSSSELPAVNDAALDDDPFANMLDDLDAADEGVAPLEPEPAPLERTNTGRVATLGEIATPQPEEPVVPLAVAPRTPVKTPATGTSSSGARPLPAKPTSGSNAGPLPTRPTTGSNAGPLPTKPATESNAGPLPKPPVTTGSVSAPAPKPPVTTGSVSAPAPKPPVTTGSVSAPAPKPPVTTGSVSAPAPKPPVTTGSVSAPAPKPPTTGSVSAPAPKPPTTGSHVGPAPKAPAPPVAKPVTSGVKPPVAAPLVAPPVVAPPVAAPSADPDPLASLLEDDVFDKLDEVDEIEEGEDEDFADSFGHLEPEPDAGRSGARKLAPPPPPPPRPKK